jgi:hypothetical protein
MSTLHHAFLERKIEEEEEEVTDLPVPRKHILSRFFASVRKPLQRERATRARHGSIAAAAHEHRGRGDEDAGPTREKRATDGLSYLRGSRHPSLPRAHGLMGSGSHLIFCASRLSNPSRPLPSFWVRTLLAHQAEKNIIIFFFTAGIDRQPQRRFRWARAPLLHYRRRRLPVAGAAESSASFCPGRRWSL